jgi:WD40 repeat protein
MIDMDARAPRPVRLASFSTTTAFFSGALRGREGSVRCALGALGKAFIIDGNPVDPRAMTTREVFVVPADAESVSTRYGRMMAVALSPDGKTLAAAGDWRDVFVLDLDHPESRPRRLRPSRGGTILSLAFVSGRLLAGNENIDEKMTDQSLSVFDLATGKLEREVPLQSSVGSIALAPDGRFAFGLSDGAIKVERLDGREPLTLKWPIGEWTSPHAVMGLAFIAGGERMLAATGDEGRSTGARIFVRSSREDEPPRLIEDGLDSILSLTVSDDGLLVATGAWGGKLDVRAVPD